MFYAHFVLAKKGPLARIWLAAHWDKKLTKAHVFETNIESSVEGILQPKVKMALRTSGHLLLGIVRIYSRKAKYLLADCNEAFIKIKIAFRPGVVDLPEGNREAAVAAITLPEVFHDFDTVPDITIDMDAQVSLNQSRAEDITLKEDYGHLSLITDDGFEEMGFEEPEAGRDAALDDGLDHASLLLAEDGVQDRTDENVPGVSNSGIGNKRKLSLDAPLRDDGFGGTVGEGLLDGETGGLFEPAGLFDDAPLGPVELDATTTEEPTTTTFTATTTIAVSNEPPALPEPIEKPLEQQADEDSDDDIYDMAPGSMGAPSPPSSPESPCPPLHEEENIPVPESTIPEVPEPRDEYLMNPMPPPEPMSDPIPDIPPQSMPEEDIPPPAPMPALDHTTLINNDAESFALAPLDALIIQGPERTIKAKRKRKLVVDEVKSISGEEMKSQLSDTTDIVATLDLAPPTKRLMHWKETGGVEKLFSLPGHRILSKTLTRAYLRHLTTRSVETETYGDDQDELQAEMEKGRDAEEASFASKRRRIMEPELPHDLSHLESFHLDTTRPSYPHDAGLPTHPSLDSFMQPPPMYPGPQMCDQMLPPPPVMPTDQHMVQQMLQPDLHQLPHIPQIMDQLDNQGPSLNSITPSIQRDSLPGVSDQSVIESSQHLLSNGIPHDHLAPIEKQIPPIEDQIDQLQNHHLPPVDFVTGPPNGTIGGAHVAAPNGQTEHDLVENSAAQSLMNQYPNQDKVDNILPVSEVEAERRLSIEVPSQNGLDLPSANTSSATNDLFDALIGDMQLQQPPPPVNDTEDAHDKSNDDVEAPHKSNNDLIGSDDEDDYAAPASVGPVIPEEQQADETYEQFEERILTKRTTHLLHVIHNSLDNDRKVSFGDLVRNNKRKQVAQKFYTFLVLKKQQAVELEQDSTYGDLFITRGPKYETVYNGN